MDRILVINLTRMGDIIQSSPLIAGLRSLHPGATIGLLVLKAFAGVAQQIPGTDQLLVLDQDQAVGRLLDDGRTLGDKASWMRQTLLELRGEGWDLVINLSHSRDSAVLAHMLTRGEVRGIRMRGNGRMLVEHDWARYFFCVTGNRAVNHFNLVDIYRLIGGLGATEGQHLALAVGVEAATRAEELLADLSVTQGRPLVMITPGASRENRRWPVERLAAVMRRLHAETGAAMLVVGSAGEQPLCSALCSLSAGIPLLNLAGRTSLEELAALCSRADLLITNDTGTLHVAAARGLRSVSLFFATALPWETGPWLPGCFVLQAEMDCAPCSHHVVCPHVMCRERIHESSVTDAALELLRRGGWPTAPGPDWEDRPGARVYETLCDRHGMQDLRLLGERRPGGAEIVARAYRELWLRCPNLADGQDAHASSAATAGDFNGWLEDWATPLPEAEEDIRDLVGDLAHLAGLAGHGMAIVSRVDEELARPSPGVAVLEQAIAELTVLDDSIFTFELSRPLLRPLGVLFRFGKDELRDEDSLDRLGRETHRLYATLHDHARRLAGILRSYTGIIRQLGDRQRGEAA